MKLILNKWLDYKYFVNNNLLNEESIGLALKEFFNYISILNQISDDQILLIIFKVTLENESVRSISELQKVKKGDLDYLLPRFIALWLIKSEEYHQSSILNITFTYKLLDDVLSQNIKSNIDKNTSLIMNQKPKMTKILGNTKLPNTMDITKWGGKISFTKDFTIAIISNIIISKNVLATAYIKLYSNYTLITLKIKGDKQSIITIKDVMNDKIELNTFTRYILNTNHEYIYKNGELVLSKFLRKTSFMKPIKSSKVLSKKFATLDLETRTINGVMIPYCVSFYDGNRKVSFYLSDFSNSEEMLEVAIKYLDKRQYHGYRIYLHNFSYFDGVFLMKILSNLSDNILPIIRDNQIIDFRIKFLSKYTLYFRDSYLILPSSLSKLAKNFSVENKGIFPYSFVNNSEIALDYIGEIPNKEHFPSLSDLQYQEYCSSFTNNTWNLRLETIKYCEQDVVTLYQIMDNFGQQIFNQFKLDIHKYPTLPSLTLALYRCCFLLEKDFKIPLILGDMFKNMKPGYSGGVVDVYKPYGDNVYGYDVNSLYPYVMKTFDMPTGTPKYFEGDILLNNDNTIKPFGIFEVEVISPNNMNIPILQHKMNGTNIAPLGTWIGWYFSEELYHALEHGYKIKVLRGYLFERTNIFNKFVDTFYKMKLNSLKTSSNYIISKLLLLLNSLYGKLGMNPEMIEHVIVNDEQSIKYYGSDCIIKNIVDFNNGKELISFSNLTKNDRDLNISLPIAAAVTGYARIHMSKLKLDLINKGFTIYYTDTDSIFVDKPLDDSLIGKDLGLLKLEHDNVEGVFICPKVYGIKGKDYELTKVKGSKNKISFDQLKSLLIKNSKLLINQEKWYRNLSLGNITIKNEIYTLMVTNNKRKFIYDNDSFFIDTKPFIIDNDKIINL